MRRVLLAGVLVLLDGVLLLVGAVILGILITGGGEGRVGAVLYRAYAYSNLLLFSLPLLLLRYWLRAQAPFLGVRTLGLEGLPSAARRFCLRAHAWLENLDAARASRWVQAIIALSILVKVLNAWVYFGFFSGDDTEIQEMSFARLFGWRWQAWNLRSPFFPLAFIHPIQAAFLHLGVRDPAVLIFAGRLVVVAYSGLNLWLAWRISRRVFDSVPAGLLTVLFLALSKLHTTFASSELPRTVASSFVLLACWFLLVRKRRSLAVVLAGLCMGVGACVRFSEGLYLLPAAVLLLGDRRWKDLPLFAMAVAAAAVLILGWGDYLYWGRPFYSLHNIFEYTVVQGASSRGHQPFYAYFAQIFSWTDPFTFVLFLTALRFTPRSMLIWAWAPLILLSALPHKEPRYLIPALPFMAMGAAWGTWNLLGRLGQDAASPDRKSVLDRWAILLVAALALGGLLQLDGFRFRRSESGVEAARFLARQNIVGVVGIEQGWKTGGSLYLYPTVWEDLNRRLMDDPAYMRGFLVRPDMNWVALQEGTIRKNHYEALFGECGFVEVRYSERTRRKEYHLFHRERSVGVLAGDLAKRFVDLGGLSSSAVATIGSCRPTVLRENFVRGLRTSSKRVQWQRGFDPGAVDRGTHHTGRTGSRPS